MRLVAAMLVTALFLFLAIVLTRASVEAGVGPSQVACVASGGCDKR